jgi:hypothetical protein
MLSGGISSRQPAQDDIDKAAYQPWHLAAKSMSTTTTLGHERRSVV